MSNTTMDDEVKEAFELLQKSHQFLQRKANELDGVRATLILNFGPDGITGKQLGVTVEDCNKYSTESLLVVILSRLCTKFGQEVGPEPERQYVHGGIR